MKSSPMPPRRAPMARTTPMTRTAWTRDPDAFTRTRARRPSSNRRTAVRRQVFARDDRCRLTGGLFGPCYGTPRTAHHLWKAGQGGPYTVWNLLTLCARHNDLVEDMPADGHALGLVVWRGDDPLAAWGRLQLAEIVPYWWDGTPGDRPRPDDYRSRR